MKKFFPVFSTLLLLVFLFLPMVTLAQLSNPNSPTGLGSGALPNPNSPTGLGSGTSCGNGGSLFQFCNPLQVGTICALIKQLLGIFLTIGTPIAVLFLVYAGFMFVTARGNASKLGVAKNNLIHVVLGICIFLGAWLMGQVIANTINAISPGTVNTNNSCS